ncbi:hypothetical protein ACF3DV_21755 [Chlorogloeopsis fritschii PCC 9212]|uniref:Uncharacterized protein n=1 Tax=Chlorogloeopsis fritschii PCC 6912 TaxID=211165 RepID=A0A433N113_CHLFR|nr:hypothetical protein [Chlorogloeopsis fritschii]RUR74650.1 hypothetical protein PCC6912_51670 [Chlorogloeopsis fritschii PCC 6912]
MEIIHLNSLTELDQLVSERFTLPVRPYSSDIRAALELSVWHLENSEWFHFEVFRSEVAQPEEPFLASFEQDAWDSGKTAPIAICKSALRYLKKVRVIITEHD